MRQSSGWSCKSGSWMGLSRLLSELELDTSSSAKSCLFICSRSCKLSWGSFGLGSTSFVVVFSGISMGINLHGISFWFGLNDYWYI